MGLPPLQGLMLVLAVDRHQRFAEGLQLGQRRQRTVDVDPVPAGAGDDALDQQLPLTFETGLRQLRHQLRLPLQGEQRLHRRLLGTAADQIGAGAVAEQQAKGIDDDRLAGPGLAGQDVEAPGKLDLQLIDNGKIADLQFDEHKETLKSPGAEAQDPESRSKVPGSKTLDSRLWTRDYRSPQRSLVRRTSK